MCGIAGYVNLSNTKKTIDENLLTRMQEKLVHRGPDDFGIWKSEIHQIGLAHRRLSIIDLSAAGKQPFFDKKQNIVLCFNGEIYNFFELRKELIAKNHIFKTETDTEVLLHGYEEYGITFLEKLDGMFAIALFDKTKEKLFLIRDRIGIKPLYFSLQNNFLSFASEIKALWELPWNKKKTSEIAFYHYLSFMVTPAPYTIFENVYKMPAGFYAEIDLQKNGRYPINKISFYEWYSPLKKLPTSEQKKLSCEKYCLEKVKFLLKESTKKRMISDVPFGAFLSGGIDSSLNVALMAQEIKKVKTFTVAFEKTQNELTWARKVAKIFDTDHHEIIISDQDVQNLPIEHKIPSSTDEPLADPVCIPFYYVAKLAKDHGVTVVQVGEGADELFFGYEVYAQYHKLFKNFWYPAQKLLPKSAKKGVFWAGTKMFPQKHYLLDAFQKLAEQKHLFCGGAIAFTELQKKVFLTQKTPPAAHDPIVEKILSGFKNTYDSRIIPQYHLQKLFSHDPNASFLKQMAYIELKQRLPELLLMRADKMSMATSIEARVPFLDHKLVEFALQIPDNIKYKNKTKKYHLKKACEDLLPKDIIYRKKMGFSAPITRWFNQDTNLHKNKYNIALQKWVLYNFEGIKNDESK